MNAFFPEEGVRSAYNFPFESLATCGMRGTVFDIDSALVPLDASVDVRCCALIQRLRTAGFQMCLVLNSETARILPFATAVNLPHVERALKPRRYGYRKVIARMGAAPTETIAIGNQPFTDTWGVNRTGAHSLPVQPMESRKEVQIRLEHPPRRLVLVLYRGKKGAEE